MLLFLSVEVLMHAKLITPKCLQGCARKLWLSWGFVGVGGDVARMLRDTFKGLLLSMEEKKHTAN